MARHRCLWACVVGALVIAATASQIQVNHDQDASQKNPHEHSTLPFKAVKPRMVGAPFATVTTEIVNTTAKYVTVNVTWTNVDFTGKTDYLALYAEGMNIGANAAIEFKYAGPAGRSAPENGSLLFTVINRRTSYYFVYVGGASQYPEEKGRSELFTPFNIYEPLQGHLALVPGYSNAIQVMWNQYQVGTPIVKVGTSPGVYSQTVSATSDTYTQSDLCDPDMSPAATSGWIEPGYFLTAQIFNLVPNQVYYYIYGDSSKNMFSTESSFQAPPAPGTPTDGTVRIIAFGDMGQAPIDGAWQHSWDFNDRGEYPALNTTALIGNLAKPGDAILHIGDISYAVGYLAEWDQFMTQIEPVATKNIWQTGIGNHEEGWTGSYFGPPADSGGECGVAYNIRFPFFQNSSTPNATPKNAWLPWYSFNYGPVHVIVTSTEHNFTAGSPQYAFVVQDFATINKTATPWTIFTAHRPMYPDSTYSGDIQVSAMLQTAFEDMLVANNVSLALYGHQHAYSRTCPVINGTCVERGPIHMVIGMAGYSLTKNPASPTPSYIAAHADDFYGVIRITVVDDHKAWVDTYATNGTVVDTFELVQ